MKLLLEQNLSFRLLPIVEPLFPGSLHVRDVGLQRAPDGEIWTYAKENGLTIVTKDADFEERSVLLSHPPKVIWIRRGNCSTDTIAVMLRDRFDAIQRFDRDDDVGVLVMY